MKTALKTILVSLMLSAPSVSVAGEWGKDYNSHNRSKFQMQRLHQPQQYHRPQVQGHIRTGPSVCVYGCGTVTTRAGTVLNQMPPNARIHNIPKTYYGTHGTNPRPGMYNPTPRLRSLVPLGLALEGYRHYRSLNYCHPQNPLCS